MSTTPQFPVVQSYLNFDGRCEEAVEFYKKALGAEVEMMLRFKDNPEPQQCSGDKIADNANKIMHTSFRIGATTVMASDCECSGQTKFQGISLSLSVQTPDEAAKFYNALADGGQPFMPLTKTFFSPSFGVVSDKFGVSWMIMAHPPKNA